MNINHTVADNFDYALAVVLVNSNIHNARVLDFKRFFLGDYLTLGKKHFTRKRSNDILRCFSSGDTRGNGKLFVIFVTSETREVVSLRVKEQIVESRTCRVNRCRLTGTEFSVNFEKSLLLVLGVVLAAVNCRGYSGILAELIDKILIA